MLNPIASFCVYFAEMVIAYIFFSGIFEHRISAKKCVLSGIALFSVCSVLNLLSRNNVIINGFSTFFMTLLFSVICFRCTFLQGVFYTVTLVVVNTALETFIVAFSSYITGTTFLDYNNNFILFLFEVISCKSAYFLFVLLITRMINPAGSSAKVPINFLIHPIVSIFCMFIFWHVSAQPDCSYQTQLLLAIAGVCLFVSSILLFVTYTHQVKKDSQALQVKAELSRLQTEQSYYQILDQQNQQLMIYAHDAKKHLAAIQALNEDPQISSYVTKLTEQLADYTRNCHSGNKLLDVMIHKYFVDCDMRGIQFDYDVRVCNLAQLDDIDLVAILGNLMDNAVSAAEQSAGKKIVLSTVHRNSYSVIVVSNSCDLPPKQSGNRLLSTKSDSSLHGFGLKSVEKTIRKYQGDFEWEYDADKKFFTVTVMVAD